jgi:hypothetical protein
MNEEHFFADVTLPFHVWVRERDGARARWVLRDARQRPQGVAGQGGGEFVGPERCPSPPLQAS